MIKIVTDTACNLPEEYIKKYSITVVPSYIFFEKEEYRENVNITYDEFCNKLREFKKIPMTAPPTSAEFVRIYQELLKEADTIFSIHLSSEVSNIYKHASIAANILNKQLNQEKIKVFDTRAVDMAAGFIIIEASQAIASGRTKSEIEKIINELMNKVKLYIYVDKLDFLVKGGRVSRLTGLLGSFLNVKPILSVENGQVVPKAKTIGSEKAKETIIELMEENIEKGKGIKLAVCDAKAERDAEDFLHRIKNKFNCKEIIRYHLSASVTVHVGLGSFGVFYY